MADRVGPERPDVDPETVAALIRGRRTIARFKPELPPASLIEAAVETARWAPNHKLTQPWRFYRLGPHSIEAVVELNAAMVAAGNGEEAARAKRRRWGAIPGWLVITRQRTGDDDDLRAREDYAACCCATQNLMLYLWSAGVASKWTTGTVTREPRFYEQLRIDPAAEEVVGLLWYGYPDESPRMRRRPTPEILFDRG